MMEKDLKIIVSIENIEVAAKAIRRLYSEEDLTDVEDIQLYMWYINEIKNINEE